MSHAPATIVIVGGGPRATGVLERLCANVPELAADLPLEIHVVDPFPFGAGRIWRQDQSPLLKTNSRAVDMTMFTDDTSTVRGPVRPGPTVVEWAAAARVSRLRSPEVNEQMATLADGSFPTRQLQSQYLLWAFWNTVHEAPANVTVHVHPYRVVDVVDTPDGRQRVCLDAAGDLVADLVVLAVGHLPARPDADEIVDFAARHGLGYVPQGYAADLDLSCLKPGEDVIVRGMGLAFVDLMILLTEGRGGRFSDDGGTLVYHPSGAEPRLHVGSRRGVPYRSKISYGLRGVPATPLRYLTPAAIAALPAAVDLRSDLWPLLAKDVAYGWYRELFTGHPERVTTPWAEFEAAFDAADWDGEAMRALVAALPVADRFDVAALDRPLRGARFPDAGALQEHLRDHVERDLRRGDDPARSPALGAFAALVPAFVQVLGLSDRLTAASYARDLGKLTGFFNYVASGPPAHRLDELLALSRAGIVRFLGADMWLRADDDLGVFVAGGGGLPDVVTATALVEARIPAPTVTRSADPLLAALGARGDIGEDVLRDGDGPAVGTGRLATAGFRVVAADGRPHPRRFALGAFASGTGPAGFPRPRTDAPFFRHNDDAARRMLTLLRDDAQPAATTVPAGDLRVRAAAPDDEAAAELFAELELEYASRYGGGNGEMDRHPRAEFAPPGGALLLLLENGEAVAGGAFRRYDGETAELKRVWTSSRHRRRGLARRVVAALEEEAARRGYGRVYLTTGPRQPEARGLYLAAGYRPLFDPAADPETIGPLPFEKVLVPAERGCVRT